MQHLLDSFYFYLIDFVTLQFDSSVATSHLITTLYEVLLIIIRISV